MSLETPDRMNGSKPEPGPATPETVPGPTTQVMVSGSTPPPTGLGAYSPPPYPYVPTQYYYPYSPAFVPTPRPRPAPALQIGFWVFYALVGFWVDLGLAIALWACALFLPFALPLTVLARTTWSQDWLFGGRSPNSYDWPWFGQSDAFVYTAAGVASVIGLAILVFAIVTAKPLARLHAAMFRNLGGLDI